MFCQLHRFARWISVNPQISEHLCYPNVMCKLLVSTPFTANKVSKTELD